MNIRFGYVANTLNLFDASPSKAMTFATWSKLSDSDRREKLHAIITTNLKNTLRALHYIVAHDVSLYRMSSSIVPLATHPEVDFDYITPFLPLYEEIGSFVRKNNLAVSFHPNQFTLFTSERDDVTKKAVEDMEYHYNLLDAMGITDRALINIHIGGSYGDKTATLARFFKNITLLPEPILKRTTFENDDKTYNAEETLLVCEQLGQPMIFDWHHHLANPSSVPWEELMPRILATWKNFGRSPKVHISSPRNEKEFRSHNEFVALDFVLPFFTYMKKLNVDFDVMIEAKNKDQAMLQLLEELSKVRGFKRTSGGVIST